MILLVKSSVVDISNPLQKKLNIQGCHSFEVAEKFLLEDQVNLIVMDEVFAMSIVDLMIQQNKQIPFAVISDQTNSRHTRYWMAQGAEFVWTSDIWKEELLSLYDAPKSNPEPVDTDSFSESMKNPVLDTKRPKRTISIGISGTDHRMGVTHCAIRTALSLANHKYSVACVELIRDIDDRSKVFASFVTDEESYYSGGFRKEDIDFFPNRTIKDLLSLYSANYDFIIIDFQPVFLVDDDIYQSEWLRQDLQIVLCGASTWDFQTFIAAWKQSQQWTNHKKNWNVLINFASPELYSDIVNTMNDLKVPLNVNFYRNEFEPDPFVKHQSNSISQILSPFIFNKKEKQRGNMISRLLGRQEGNAFDQSV